MDGDLGTACIFHDEHNQDKWNPALDSIHLFYFSYEILKSINSNFLLKSIKLHHAVWLMDLLAFSALYTLLPLELEVSSNTIYMYI